MTVHSRNVLFILMLISQASIFAHHKIIYLISPPRSLSVAFTRMMQERKDFIVFHEPAQKAFNAIHHPDFIHWYREEVPRTYEEVINQILLSSENSPVFVKEMGFAVAEFLTTNKQVLEDQEIYFIFLLRDPHATTISFFHRFEDSIYNLRDIIGYKCCYEIYRAICSVRALKPLIIKTEDLYLNSKFTIQKFCEYCNIPFIPDSLQWKDLGEDFNGIQEWHEAKFADTTHHWHGDAIRSTGFHRPHDYVVDVDGNPTFEEISVEYRAAYQDAYYYNKPYYDLLLAECP